ncbi:MAG: thioesterase family protein [Pyrinomonadaceae bacterium]
MHQYTRRFRVRHYELDSFNHVNNAVYANYLQEAAIEASADAGFDLDWYQTRGTRWVIRELSIRYHTPASYLDELDVTTWVSEVRRATSTREYLITRVSDGAMVARARVNWVYVDATTGRPTRIDEAFTDSFAPDGKQEPIGIRIEKATPTVDAHRYHTRRRVQMRELDPSQHVNNGVYLHWIEQAYFDAIRAGGHPVEAWEAQGIRAFQGGHSIEYFNEARDNEEIEIVSWICEMGKVRGSWTHEIFNATTGVLLAREYSLGIFVDMRGRLVPAPADIVKDILRGPADEGVKG